MQKTIKERLLNLSHPEPNSGCWLWLGKNKGGKFPYGRIRIKGKWKPAHRISYEVFKGPIAEGLDPDHLCNTPLCINPDHIEPKTKRANRLRGNGASAQNARKTHCRQGHLFSHTDKVGHRFCRLCQRKRWQAKKARRRAKKNL